MKKHGFFISFLLLLFVCCVGLHGCSSPISPKVDPTAATTVASAPISHGTFGNYEYDEYEDHVVLTASLSDESVVWLPHTIADKPVTGFGSIFSRNFRLSIINIPGSYEAIEERAFYMCDHLATVNVSDGLKSIGKEAFAGCANLSVAKIPASVTSIADDAFLYCLNLVIFGEEGSAIQHYADRFQSINFRPNLKESSVAAENSEAKREESSAAQTTVRDDTSTTAAPKTTAPKTTAPPATQPPATEPPATEPPATEPPATEPPATEPPATEPPVESGETTTLPDDSIEV